MKNIVHCCVSAVTILIWCSNAQYAALANQVNAKKTTATIKSIINNLNHSITIQFPRLTHSSFSIAQGDVFDTNKIPAEVFAPMKGIIQNDGSFYATDCPAIKIITPQQQTFIIFIGTLYQETFNDTEPECGIWIFKIKEATSMWADYGGFACTVEHKDRATNAIPNCSLIIDVNWRKIPPHKSKPEFIEEISITRYDPVYNRNRSTTSPVTPPPALINRPQSSLF